ILFNDKLAAVLNFSKYGSSSINHYNENSNDALFHTTCVRHKVHWGVVEIKSITIIIKKVLNVKNFYFEKL
ncbi:MAG: hypothetical protein ACE5QV_02900, partial [Fidelibacterota bacterium]